MQGEVRVYLPDFTSHSTGQVMGHSQEETMLPTVCVCVCWGVPAAIYLWLDLSSTLCLGPIWDQALYLS